MKIFHESGSLSHAIQRMAQAVCAYAQLQANFKGLTQEQPRRVLPTMLCPSDAWVLPTTTFTRGTWAFLLPSITPWHQEAG